MSKRKKDNREIYRKWYSQHLDLLNKFIDCLKENDLFDENRCWIAMDNNSKKNFYSDNDPKKYISKIDAEITINSPTKNEVTFIILLTNGKVKYIQDNSNILIEKHYFRDYLVDIWRGVNLNNNNTNEHSKVLLIIGNNVDPISFEQDNWNNKLFVCSPNYFDNMIKRWFK